MVAGRGVVEHAQSVAAARRSEPADPGPAIAGEAQQELSVMTAVGDVPDVAREMVAMSARHDPSS